MLSVRPTWTRRASALVTAIAGLVGGVLGYSAAGLGGSVLFGCLLAAGGIILGSLVAKTAVLLQRAWTPFLIGLGLAALTILTWGVRF